MKGGRFGAVFPIIAHVGPLTYRILIEKNFLQLPWNCNLGASGWILMQQSADSNITIVL